MDTSNEAWAAAMSQWSSPDQQNITPATTALAEPILASSSFQTQASVDELLALLNAQQRDTTQLEELIASFATLKQELADMKHQLVALDPAKIELTSNIHPATQHMSAAVETVEQDMVKLENIINMGCLEAKKSFAEHGATALDNIMKFFKVEQLFDKISQGCQAVVDACQGLGDKVQEMRDTANRMKLTAELEAKLSARREHESSLQSLDADIGGLKEKLGLTVPTQEDRPDPDGVETSLDDMIAELNAAYNSERPADKTAVSDKKPSYQEMIAQSKVVAAMQNSTAAPPPTKKPQTASL